jgi:hypothetical protein
MKMKKALSIAKLDFLTIAPYLTARMLAVYGIIALFMLFLDGNILIIFGLAAMLAALFTGYPFAIAEKSNMDALYVTLGADRKTVVLGRYLFALSMFVLAVIAAIFIEAADSLIVAGAASDETVYEGSGAVILVIAVLMILFELFQLPIYFKMPYTKSKFVALITFGFVGAIMGAFMTSTASYSYETLIKSANAFFANPVLFGVIIFAILGIAVIISYSLSVGFYRKREF